MSPAYSDAPPTKLSAPHGHYNTTQREEKEKTGLAARHRSVGGGVGAAAASSASSSSSSSFSAVASDETLEGDAGGESSREQQREIEAMASENKFFVGKILSERLEDGVRSVEIKWEGYSEEHNTFEKLSSLCKPLQGKQRLCLPRTKSVISDLPSFVACVVFQMPGRVALIKTQARRVYSTQHSTSRSHHLGNTAGLRRGNSTFLIRVSLRWLNKSPFSDQVMVVNAGLRRTSMKTLSILEVSFLLSPFAGWFIRAASCIGLKANSKSLSSCLVNTRTFFNSKRELW